ncbi:phosphatidate phosphatase APP1 [Saccharomyces eubayanus]|uniref:phosphatidate phosphatase APP1 n=1 Tax=Saccharomyces eubayanus TaxID=1080349 RepID=UPI0006C284FC|nr:APP1-like protein [Saccharomyces eubayanus]KOG97064.1 APP1-like protein [Saccharomyces eubayanus]
MNGQDYDESSSSAAASTNPVSVDQRMGKKQRFMNLMRTTKDVYIPNLTSSISQKTMDGIRSTTNSFEGSNDMLPQLPYNTMISFYPTYTTTNLVGSDGVSAPRKDFETTVRCAVSYPGNPTSRRNRWLVSLCKQYLRTGTVEADIAAVVPARLEDDAEDLMDSQSSIDSSSSSKSGNTSPHTGTQEEDVLNERIQGFLARKVPNTPIVVDLLPKDSLRGDTASFFGTTDYYGNLLLKAETDFLPSKINITLDTPVAGRPDSISQSFPVNYVSPYGVGLISDIDDTIKHTGVTGDKRSMFRNVFIHDVKSWVIDGVPLWYKTLHDVADVDFFYVSNSPTQTFPILKSYIYTNYPPGPIFLKQYSGNFFSTIMTSSANRKIEPIMNILRDFPKKKFILVGDSGEHDLEAYTTTALQFPNQILAIYIRCCSNSMSDSPLHEQEVMREVNNIIELQQEPIQTPKSSLHTRRRPPPPPPPVPSSRKPSLTKEQTESIRLSRHNEVENTTNKAIPPPLPKRTLPNVEADDYCLPSSQNDYGMYGAFMDRKADEWKRRVMDSIQKLSNQDTTLMFFSDPAISLEDSIRRIREKYAS